VRRLSALIWAILFAIVGSSAMIAQPTVAQASGSLRVALSHHHAAFVDHAKHLGPANATDQLDVTIWLQPRDAAGLVQLAGDVSTPGSASDGQFLTPGTFDARFAPSESSYDAVESYLRAQGLSVTRTVQNRLYVTAHGTVAQIEAAFGVDLERYEVGGQSVLANANDPTLPAALARNVAAIGGLDGAAVAHPNVATVQPHGTKPTPVRPRRQLPTYAQLCAAIAPNATPGYIPCPYDPAGLAAATGFANSGASGAGQRIAIVEAYGSPTLAGDLQLFDATFGVRSARVTQIGPTTFDASNPNAQGWDLETNLDAEWAHALAPDASIRLYVAPTSSSDLLFAQVDQIVADDSAHLVSLSWDDPEDLVPPALLLAQNTVFLAAAVEGIGVDVATGDCGDNSACLGVPTANFPASSPFVTAVGGVSLLHDGTLTPWGTAVCYEELATSAPGIPACSNPPPAFDGGGGGGYSAVFAAPPWQRVAAGFDNPMRGLPDVSMDADPYSGVWMTLDGGYLPIGGTSLAAPTFTAVMALADQVARRPHGLATPWLYQVASPAGAVRDVLPTTTSLLYLSLGSRNLYQIGFGTDQGLLAGTGWDDATGLGIPTGSEFLTALDRLDKR